ncbi:MFS transporter [Glycomyces sp. TRM65418]|uniref:MFS transporter n=1 Tax=Glycomyces sp. TRM65418 TaxID=2867006 RepID=UPI001CE4BBC0|nr:MFS transporter [Glycomyces sp. TRM65418]MCC3764360.1 MFS transporter [Glycomyces sp. TRM65418]QZD54039.1 MFS transporter [Glycomyces sp. TRM65418]
MTPDLLARRFLAWNFLRAVLHQGWWLVTSLYMVVDAGLSTAELLLIAAAQGIASFAFEIPAGALADTVGRKPAIVVSHLLMAAAMITTGLSPEFAPLMIAQMLWGISWTFASGADVAWATDEIDRPDRIHLLLAAQGRWQMIGAGTGILAFGALATLIDRPTAIVAAGVLMLALGAWFARCLPERNFIRIRTRHVHAALDIARRGARLAVRDRTLLVLVAVTILVNGAADAFGRVYPVALADLGLPTGPAGTAWFTAIALAGYVLAALALTAVQRGLHTDRGTRTGLIAACLTGAFGLALTGLAPTLELAVAAVIIASGIAMPLTRTLTAIWVNRRTTSDIRATTHSFFAQSEYIGEILCTATLASLAATGGTFVLTATLCTAAAAILALHRPNRTPTPR